MENNKTTELKNCEASLLARAACAVLLEKKALDVRMFCVEGKTSVTDFYVNCTGKSSTQVAAIADYVSELIGEGKADVRVLDNVDKWYGVTYKEDKEMIVNAFRDLKAKGIYPENF